MKSQRFIGAVAKRTERSSNEPCAKKGGGAVPRDYCM